MGARWLTLGLVMVCGVASAAPNILFIYTDDQGDWSVGAWGNEDARTPHLDRLYSEGVVLTEAFVSTPVCSPSRASLITGRYGSEWGITDWLKSTGEPRNEAEVGLAPLARTWVADLRDAGYETALVGKWHLGVQDRYHPTVFGYEHFFGFRHGEQPSNPVVEVGFETSRRDGLTVDLLTDEALRLIRERDDSAPFLISLHYRAPHRPWTPVRAEDAAPYDAEALAIPNPDFPDLDVEEVRTRMAEYLASVSSIDRNVGRLLDALDGEGIADETVVVFTSDHGYNIGHHGLWSKGNAGWITNAARGKRHPEIVRPNMFDTSLRVPCVVRWPETLPSGKTMDRVVSNVDWYPTLLAMAGVEVAPEQKLRGRDFLPLLKGEAVAWDDSLYGEYSIRHYTEADLRMIRTREWKLVRDFGNGGKDELYDLVNDPGETLNLIGDGRYGEKVAALSGMLEAVLAEKMDFVLGE